MSFDVSTFQAGQTSYQSKLDFTEDPDRRLLHTGFNIPPLVSLKTASTPLINASVQDYLLSCRETKTSDSCQHVQGLSREVTLSLVLDITAFKSRVERFDNGKSTINSCPAVFKIVATDVLYKYRVVLKLRRLVQRSKSKTCEAAWPLEDDRRSLPRAPVIGCGQASGSRCHNRARESRTAVQARDGNAAKPSGAPRASQNRNDQKSNPTVAMQDTVYCPEQRKLGCYFMLGCRRCPKCPRAMTTFQSKPAADQHLYRYGVYCNACGVQITCAQQYEQHRQHSPAAGFSQALPNQQSSWPSANFPGPEVWQAINAKTPHPEAETHPCWDQFDPEARFWMYAFCHIKAFYIALGDEDWIRPLPSPHYRVALSPFYVVGDGTPSADTHVTQQNAGSQADQLVQRPTPAMSQRPMPGSSVHSGSSQTTLTPTITRTSPMQGLNTWESEIQHRILRQADHAEDMRTLVRTQQPPMLFVSPDGIQYSETVRRNGGGYAMTLSSTSDMERPTGGSSSALAQAFNNDLDLSSTEPTQYSSHGVWDGNNALQLDGSTGQYDQETTIDANLSAPASFHSSFVPTSELIPTPTNALHFTNQDAGLLQNVLDADEQEHLIHAFLQDPSLSAAHTGHSDTMEWESQTFTTNVMPNDHSTTQHILLHNETAVVPPEAAALMPSDLLSDDYRRLFMAYVDLLQRS